VARESGEYDDDRDEAGTQEYDDGNESEPQKYDEEGGTDDLSPSQERKEQSRDEEESGEENVNVAKAIYESELRYFIVSLLKNIKNINLK